MKAGNNGSQVPVGAFCKINCVPDLARRVALLELVENLLLELSRRFIRIVNDCRFDSSESGDEVPLEIGFFQSAR